MKLIQYLFASLCLITSLCNCTTTTEASQIVQDAIEAHGSKSYNQLQVQFIFRKKNVMLYQRKDSFNYATTFKDSLGRTVKDQLSNQGFHREIDRQKNSLARQFKNGLQRISKFNSIFCITTI